MDKKNFVIGLLISILVVIVLLFIASNISNDAYTKGLNDGKTGTIIQIRETLRMCPPTGIEVPMAENMTAHMVFVECYTQ